jgi:hypothetical protein
MAEAQRYADISLCTKTIVQSDYNDIINSMYRGFHRHRIHIYPPFCYLLNDGRMIQHKII